MKGDDLAIRLLDLAVAHGPVEPEPARAVDRRGASTRPHPERLGADRQTRGRFTGRNLECEPGAVAPGPSRGPDLPVACCRLPVTGRLFPTVSSQNPLQPRLPALN